VGIKWRESLSIGVEEIDNQHRELLRHFDALLGACEAGRGTGELKKLLDFLDEYVQQHFRAEERLQRLYSYPDYEGHLKEHGSFVDRIRTLQDEVARDGVALHHLVETNDLLFKWLVNHISKADMALGVFLNKSEA
jgi:hemerythrin